MVDTIDSDESVATDMADQLVEGEKAEKMLSQSHVNKLIMNAKKDAAQKARQEAEAEYQRMMEEMTQQDNATSRPEAPSQEHYQPQSRPDMRDVDANAIYQQVQERFNQDMQARQLEEEVARAAQSYVAKVQAARQDYEDFDEITNTFDPSAFPQLTFLLADTENGGDVVYELAKNPSKLVAFDALATRAPQMAKAELTKLAQSIANNKRARIEEDSTGIPAPINQPQQSRISGGNGRLSIRDLKNQPWLRG